MISNKGLKQETQRSTKIISSSRNLPQPSLIAHAVAVAFFTCNVLSAPAEAATILVDSNLDDGTDCTLRDSIVSINNEALEPGCSIVSGVFGEYDEVIFAASLNGNTIALNGTELVIDSRYGADARTPFVNIDASSLADGITLDGLHASRILNARRSHRRTSLSNVNFVNGGDGAIYGSVMLRNCEISGTRDGPAIEGDSVNIYGCTIFNNTQVSSGLGTISSNSSYGLIVIEKTTVENNFVGKSQQGGGGVGGGLFISGLDPLVIVSSSVFRNNYAEENGGAIYVGGFLSNIHIDDSTLVNNTAGSNGGAIWGKASILSNSTISGNLAGNLGGGIYGDPNSSISRIENSSIVANSARYGGGVWIRTRLSLENSIIAGSGGTYDCYSRRDVDLISTSIIEDGSCRGVATKGNPGLLPLAYNGGLTPTHALAFESLARDSGSSCGSIDQRGQSRSDSACDIGAFEFKPLVVTSAVDTVFGCTLRDAVNVINLGTMNNGCAASGPSEEEQTSIVFDADISNSNSFLIFGQLEVLPGKTVNIWGKNGVRSKTITILRPSRVFNVDNAELNLFHVTLEDGFASGDGGAIRAVDSVLSLTDSKVTLSVADRGGGIFAENSEVILNRVQLSENTAAMGGGVLLDSGMNHSFTGVDILANSSSHSGAGVFLENAATVNMFDTRIIENDAQVQGGGIYAGGLSNVTIEQAEVSFNQASTGAGIQLFGSSALDTRNVTLSANQATNGGGLGVDSSTATLINTTIAKNIAQSGAGLYANNNSTIDLKNTIIADSGNAGDCDLSATLFTANPASIVEDGTCGNQPRLGSPSLVSLSYNGGRNRSHALSETSFAVDTADVGECPVADQRGRERFSNDSSCDVGAIEYKSGDDVELSILVLPNGKAVVVPN